MSNLGTVQGYRRENGRVGIRNHVLILPLDDHSNSACEKVAYGVKGTKAIPHAYGRLQFGEDLQLFFRRSVREPTPMWPPWSLSASSRSGPTSL